MIAESTLPISPEVLRERLLSLYSCCDGFLMLESNGNQSSYICLEPVASFSVEPENGSPWYRSLAEQILPILTRLNPDGLFLPIVAGYLSYELGLLGHNLPLAAADPYGIPLAQLYCYRSIVRFKPGSQVATLFQIDTEAMGKPLWEVDWEALRARTQVEPSSSPKLPTKLPPLENFASFSGPAYQEAVSGINDLISQGEVYQVNVSQRFSVPCSYSSKQLYKELYAQNSSNYFAHLSCKPADDQPFSIVSISPELFLRMRGGMALCSPIKGTIERFGNAEDTARRQNLLSSEKNLAELAMIVDLTRNDLGKVCQTDSISVRDFPRIEEYPHLFHLVADVSGMLKSELTVFDALGALFPCGSITGAPKIAAMKFISTFEAARRGVYTGAIGFIASPRDCQWSVAIRTGVLKNNSFIFQTGGGVVYDSDPRSEHEESLLKAKGIYEALCSLE